ncbi:MAG TPA: cytochrome c-type biogenesis protein CcmH [Bryobacteraceae bacterium]|nr:cytochrome c-type biogenesis protein CcmH [Bryobacteraceae bacterium]
MLARRPSQFSLKLFLAFFGVMAALVGQSAAPGVSPDSTSYWTPDVMRVGQRLACRCGGCRNTVGDCPMLHCESADPKRHRIYDMKQQGASDNDIVNTVVREEGIVALATPPTEGFGPLLTWAMPGIALLLGFFVYSRWVKRNRKGPEPETLTARDKAIMDKFRAQIDHELE